MNIHLTQYDDLIHFIADGNCHIEMDKLQHWMFSNKWLSSFPIKVSGEKFHFNGKNNKNWAFNEMRRIALQAFNKYYYTFEMLYVHFIFCLPSEYGLFVVYSKSQHQLEAMKVLAMI